jgi:response regulator RpfG family c-di-GMP phosphodiesterase
MNFLSSVETVPTPPRICVIDDNPVVALRLRKFLKAGGFDDVTVFRGAQAALDAFRRHVPELVLVDYRMPGVDGIRFIELMRSQPSTRDLPILMFSGYSLATIRSRALGAGASEVLSKNVTARELLAHVKCLLRAHLQLAWRSPDALEWPAIDGMAEALPVTAVEPSPGGWGALAAHATNAEISAEDRVLLHHLEKIAKLRDDSTSQHTSRMAQYAAAIGRRYGLAPSQAQMLCAAAPLHDLGKIGTPDAVLHKPGPLTPQEWVVMKRHSVQGHELLCDSPSPAIRLGAEIALSHHERWDGSGYPHGLAGEAIPLSGRLVAVADVLDALTSERSYKRAWTFERALAEIEANAGSHFDPKVVQALVAARTEVLAIKQRYADEELAEAATSSTQH